MSCYRLDSECKKSCEYNFSILLLTINSKADYENLYYSESKKYFSESESNNTFQDTHSNSNLNSNNSNELQVLSIPNRYQKIGTYIFSKINSVLDTDIFFSRVEEYSITNFDFSSNTNSINCKIYRNTTGQVNNNDNIILGSFIFLADLNKSSPRYSHLNNSSTLEYLYIICSGTLIENYSISSGYYKEDGYNLLLSQRIMNTAIIRLYAPIYEKCESKCNEK